MKRMNIAVCMLVLLLCGVAQAAQVPVRATPDANGQVMATLDTGKLVLVVHTDGWDLVKFTDASASTRYGWVPEGTVQGTGQSTPQGTTQSTSQPASQASTQTQNRPASPTTVQTPVAVDPKVTIVQQAYEKLQGVIRTYAARDYQASNFRSDLVNSFKGVLTGAMLQEYTEYINQPEPDYENPVDPNMFGPLENVVLKSSTANKITVNGNRKEVSSLRDALSWYDGGVNTSEALPNLLTRLNMGNERFNALLSQYGADNLRVEDDVLVTLEATKVGQTWKLSGKKDEIQSARLMTVNGQYLSAQNLTGNANATETLSSGSVDCAAIVQQMYDKLSTTLASFRGRNYASRNFRQDLLNSLKPILTDEILTMYSVEINSPEINFDEYLDTARYGKLSEITIVEQTANRIQSVGIARAGRTVRDMLKWNGNAIDETTNDAYNNLLLDLAMSGPEFKRLLAQYGRDNMMVVSTYKVSLELDRDGQLWKIGPQSIEYMQTYLATLEGQRINAQNGSGAAAASEPVATTSSNNTSVTANRTSYQAETTALEPTSSMNPPSEVIIKSIFDECYRSHGFNEYRITNEYDKVKNGETWHVLGFELRLYRMNNTEYGDFNVADSSRLVEYAMYTGTEIAYIRRGNRWEYDQIRRFKERALIGTEPANVQEQQLYNVCREEIAKTPRTSLTELGNIVDELHSQIDLRNRYRH